MARAATTADVFNAIAEPRRRELIDLLAVGADEGEPVGSLVELMRLPQPAVSKHLGVLRQVGIVSVSRRGRERVYKLNPMELKPVHSWVKTFERFWDEHLLRIKERAERKVRSPHASTPPGSKEKGTQ